MKIALIAVICIVAICLAVFTYYGAFRSLNIRIAEQGGETIVYDPIVGDYRQSGVVMDKIYYSLLNDYKIETFKGYAKYYDNPKKVEKSKLRSEAGCVIEPKDLDKAAAVDKYKKAVVPKREVISTEFPYKGKLSVVFSLMKVYPALTKFAEKNGLDGDGAITEIYDIPNKRIYYRKEFRGK